MESATNIKQILDKTVLWHPLPVYDNKEGVTTAPHPFFPVYERVAATIDWAPERIVPGSGEWTQLPHYRESAILAEHGPFSCVLVHGYTDTVPITGIISLVNSWKFIS